MNDSFPVEMTEMKSVDDAQPHAGDPDRFTININLDLMIVASLTGHIKEIP